MTKLLSNNITQLKQVVSDTALLTGLVLQLHDVDQSLVTNDVINNNLLTATRKFQQLGKPYLVELATELKVLNPNFEPYLDTVYLICLDYLSKRLTLDDIRDSSIFDIACLYYGVSLKKANNTPVRSSIAICSYLSCDSLKYLSQVSGIQVSTLNVWFRNKLPLFFAVARQVGDMRQTKGLKRDHNALSNALASINGAIEQLKK